MKSHFVCLSLLAAAVLVRSFDPDNGRNAASPRIAERPSVPEQEGAKLLHRVPVAFVPNLGQWEHPARYVARLGATTVLLLLATQAACSAEVADEGAAEEVSQSEDGVVGQDELELGAGLPRADFSRPLPASAKTTSLVAWDTPAKGQGSRG